MYRDLSIGNIYPASIYKHYVGKCTLRYWKFCMKIQWIYLKGGLGPYCHKHARLKIPRVGLAEIGVVEDCYIGVGNMKLQSDQCVCGNVQSILVS